MDPISGPDAQQRGTPANPFRFFDNRERYLQFVHTCNEKQVIADRIYTDTTHIRPSGPGLRVFDAGMGDATVLTRVIRSLHSRFPEVPFLVVAKEASQEDVRISLEKMADRFHEHPQTVLAVTNMFYTEAPWFHPRSQAAQRKMNWIEVALKGRTAFEFDEQIRQVEGGLQEWWRTTTSERSGNPVYASPSVLIMYRADQTRSLASLIPKEGDRDYEYDIVIAAQPFRARLSAAAKVRTVLVPLARSLAPGGCMVVIQATGKDPGMEIVRKIWPKENPFQTPRQILLRELRAQLGAEQPQLRYLSYPDSQAHFRYDLRVGAAEVSDNIGTSTVLAAWNAVTYVAQIEDERLQMAMKEGAYLDATAEVLAEHSGLWFTDESFVVARE